MNALRERGITNAEGASRGVEDDRIENAIRWYDHERFQLGAKIGKGLLAKTIREGGLAEFDPDQAEYQQAKKEPDWFQTYQGREKWINANVSDLDPLWAETAIIGLLQAKQNPTAELVREWATAAEQDQEVHDRDCHASAQAQMKKAIQFRRMKDFPKDEPEPMKKLDVSKALR